MINKLMIFYFSATGNCKYTAKKLAETTDDNIMSMTDCLNNLMENNFLYELKENERLGFITPVYFFGLPTIVIDFLNKLTLKYYNNYAYHIITYGTTTGYAHNMMNKILKSKGVNINGKFSVRMVDTYTPIFNLSDKEKNDKITSKAEKKIYEISKKVLNRTSGDFVCNKIPSFIARFEYLQYDKFRKTKNFRVLPSCIGCNLCAKKCPVNAIEMQAHKPVWIKDKCALCLGCLHRCPKFAIQYGKNTEKHGQFINPNI